MRWEGDETGHGVADGSTFAPDIRRLLEEMASQDWVTEAPEAHLLPHLRRWCESADSPFTIESAELDGSVFVVTLSHRGVASNPELRPDVFALLATIAEPTTVIVERDVEGAVEYDVTIGMTLGQSPFEKGHGHLVRFRLVPD
jgi:hypothetical protein